MSTQQDEVRNNYLVQLSPEEIVIDEEIKLARPGYPTELDIVKIEELAKSIESTSQLEPIVVRRHGSSFHLVAGRRRLDAVALLNSQRVNGDLKTIAAVVTEYVNEDNALRAAIAENLQRENLNPIQEAQLITTIREK